MLPRVTRAKLARGLGAGFDRGVVKVLPAVKAAIHYVSVHTGLPALVVAAIAIVVGYKILKRTGRFALEVTVVSIALVAATEMGWLRW